MFGLKSLTKRSAAIQPPTADDRTTSAQIAETVIPARRGLLIGRQLSFTIDQSGLQMAASRHLGTRAKILDVRKLYFPSNLDGDTAKQQFIRRAASEYIRSFGGKYPRITVTVSGPDTAFRTFVMPPMTRKALTAAVGFEAKKQIPFPINDSLFGFRPLNRVDDGGRGGTRVALFAATRRLVSDELALLEEQGYETAAVHHTHEVIGQLLSRLKGFSHSNHYTLINVERNRTEISFYRGSNLEFYHICSLGSSFLSNRRDATVFEYFAESLAGEIQNSLDYYTGQYSGQFTTRIYMYGDLSYSAELIDRLHEHFGYEFKRFPSEELTCGEDVDFDNRESISVCLPVVAGVMCATRIVNLLPHDRMQRLRARAIKRFARAAIIVLALALGVEWLSERRDISENRHQLSTLTQQANSIKSSTLYETYNSLKREIDARQMYLDKIKQNPTYLWLNLKELSNLTPVSVQLAALEYQPMATGPNLRLQGVVHSGDIPPEVILADYVEGLAASPFYHDVTVVRYAKRTQGRGFELEFELSMRGLV